MVAPIQKLVERGEPEVRLRTNFMNQLVIQVRYRVVDVRTSNGTLGHFSDWRDARSTDPAEVAKVFGIVSGLKEIRA